MDRIALIEQALAKLSPTVLTIQDDSHKHAGHAGARDGRGHFSVLIVSSSFDGLSSIKRHQLVYQALSGLLESDIHALAIKAKTPAEAGRQG